VSGGLTVEQCDLWIARYTARGNRDMVDRWLDARQRVADDDAVSAAFMSLHGRPPERNDEFEWNDTWLRFIVIGDLAALWINRDASDRIRADNHSRKMWREFL
jgi:hypothetical protein